MKQSFWKMLLLIGVVILFIQCDNERDAYFEEPSWIDPPIYEVLQKEGRFNLFLECVDRTLHASSFKGSGYFTVFAPNDDAVKSFLTSKGYQSVADIPQQEVENLVAYTMIYNAYQINQLTDVVAGGVRDTLQSTKKKTPYYETIRKVKDGNDSIWIVDANMQSGYTQGDNNYKFLPFYLESYFSTRPVPLDASDYNTFYSTPYTGKNIQDASAVKTDMLARNGVVHEIDKVLEPLPTLEKILEDPNYSDFKRLIEKKGPTGVPYYYAYLTAPWLTTYFKTMYPTRDIDMIYCKFYDLVVPINNERFGSTAKDSESNGFTVFAPDNNAVKAFYEQCLKNYYNSIDDLPADVLSYFINAHMVTELVWPKFYSGTMNYFNDFLNGQGTKGPGLDKNTYYDIRPASNGFFYGSNNYIRSHYFETVYTEIFLNTANYEMLNNAFLSYFQNTLREELMRCELSGYTQEDYTVLLPSNELLIADGFSWGWGGSSYAFSFSNTLASASARMQRLVRSHIFKRIHNSDIDTRITDFKGNSSLGYDGYAYAINDFGDMIRYKDGKVQLLGNYDENDWVTPTYLRSFSNGQVFTIDKMLQYSRRNTQSSTAAGWEEQSMLTYINNAAKDNPNISRYNEYMTYLMTCDNALTLSKDGYYTLLMPTNDAMDLAIASDLLPPLDSVKLTSTTKYLFQAKDFMNYHILVGRVYANDGYDQILLSTGGTQKTDVVNTALKILIETTSVRVEKDFNNNLTFTTMNTDVTRQASVIKGITRSNLFGAKAVLHEIDNYLVYEKKTE